jgi:hypothetical protein
MTTEYNDPSVPLPVADMENEEQYHNLFVRYALLQRTAALEASVADEVAATAAAAAATKRATFVLPLIASENTFASFYPVGAVSVTGYKFVRSDAAGDTLTVAMDRITRTTGAVATVLSTAQDLAAGTADVEQTITPSTAAPHALTALQGLKLTVAAGASVTLNAITIIVEYV